MCAQVVEWSAKKGVLHLETRVPRFVTQDVGSSTCGGTVARLRERARFARVTIGAVVSLGQDRRAAARVKHGRSAASQISFWEGGVDRGRWRLLRHLDELDVLAQQRIDEG